MNQVLLFGMGSSRLNFQLKCVSAILYDFDTLKYDILGFFKSIDTHELLTKFIYYVAEEQRDLYKRSIRRRKGVLIPESASEKLNSHIIFKSRAQAIFFIKEHSINTNDFEVRYLEQKVDKEDNEIFQFLIENLSYGKIFTGNLNKSSRDILEKAIKDIDDALTQSLLVATAKQPSLGMWNL